MTNYQKLWVTILSKVRKARNLADVGLTDNFKEECAIRRAAQIFTLDVLLHEYRKSLDGTLVSLNGKNALLHKLMNKYHWTPEFINSMNLEHTFLALADELHLSNLSPEAQEPLLRIDIPNPRVDFGDYLSTEWDPNIAELLLRTQPQ
ncbi:TPA: ECs1072 family phage-associated protein [Yersinia enterocolitica]|uniref:Uncharacterized protein n=1 Tax=Yersinia aleksiciae TaxID=263819 RepID=A0ABM5U8L7_YERAE|nr:MULTISPECIES: hypothetical protein [Yersinia]AKP32053.1 hypothetical protein ACZ76_00030 [Yersinia aleksiciae]MBW5816827.1 hypothetical protein [Yersinia kristensenii]CFQ33850.1 Uncharacterised protein [Yersinia aleksiciae]HDL7398674.1 hypothetical protein [Yersinia enterocolitica]